MPSIRILNPNDQPTGKWRLVESLRQDLKSGDYDVLKVAVAFAKTGPLLRLQEEIAAWISQKKQIHAIFGINHRGTSRQALQFALDHFSRSYILHFAERLTFHPKIYLFAGPKRARFYIGSHNLTVGGTETNWESGTIVDLELPAEKKLLESTAAIWESMRELSLELTPVLLEHHASANNLLDESKPSSGGGGPGRRTQKDLPEGIELPQLKVVPPSALPKSVFKKDTKRKTAKAKPAKKTTTEAPRVPTETLVIQIVPHDNGEVFLSKLAVNQNPDFFGFPFEGQTTPKKHGKQPYPQRLPDPVVNLTVYGKNDKILAKHRNFGLNTVYYEDNSEIRITVPQDVVKHAPEYSILVMRGPDDATDYDYDLDVFTPESPQYDSYLSVCNQTMPSGGKPKARKWGWL